MSDPLRTDTSRALDAASVGDRDAKIEQLLLLGLDHYFAAQYDQAINVWTRALFLDRTHPRARAYIDRARSALAEQQRESEELLQRGIAAFHRGDADEARTLLHAAIERGAPAEEAMALLDRLSRLGPVVPVRPDRVAFRAAKTADANAEAPAAPRRGRAVWTLVMVVAVLVAGAALAVFTGHVPGGLFTGDAVSGGAPPLTRDLLPVPPRRADLALARARSLAASGYLNDALDVLDSIPSTDAQRDEADRLRADIQRQLLALAPMPPPLPAKGESQP
jgi:hypothetical protein